MSPNLCDLIKFSSRSDDTSTMVESQGFLGGPRCAELTLSASNQNLDEGLKVFIEACAPIMLFRHTSVADRRLIVEPFAFPSYLKIRLIGEWRIKQILKCRYMTRLYDKAL